MKQWIELLLRVESILLHLFRFVNFTPPPQQKTTQTNKQTYKQMTKQTNKKTNKQTNIKPQKTINYVSSMCMYHWI